MLLVFIIHIIYIYIYTHTDIYMLSYIISFLIHVTHLSYVDCDSVSLVVCAEAYRR